MKVVCVCPTYKRPELLANAVACYEAQTYANRELLILDDAGQIAECCGDKWSLQSIPNRFPTLMQKFNALISSAKSEIIVPWEDDDIYLPDHLQIIVNAITEHDAEFITPARVFSNYGGKWRDEKADGRFHGSWAYAKNLWNFVGRYLDVGLIFDQDLRARMMKEVAEVKTTKNTYVYRWGNPTYHGSSHGMDGFAELYRSLEALPAPPVAAFKPRFDDYTTGVLGRLGWTQQLHSRNPI